ncbi:MAG: TetR/AcrR family transcriptional regulator [Thermodesulfobacteriota bacterium]
MRESRKGKGAAAPARTRKAEGDPSPPAEKILKAAEDVFAEAGYKAATTREIAARAGVNIAAIHYYWGTKNELWYAVVYNVLSRMADLARSLSGVPAHDLENGIRQAVGSFVDVFADNPNYARLLQHRTMEGVRLESAKELSLPVLNQGLAFLAEHGKGRAEAPFDPALVLFGLQGALRIFFQERESVKRIFGEDPFRMSPGFRQKIKDLVSAMALCLAGIGPGPGTGARERKGDPS